MSLSTESVINRNSETQGKYMADVLAFIPARGGSKGVPDKNIRLLAGKPLIAWTIEQAVNSKQIDRVIVSTDSNKIAEVSREYGAETPFMRPDELANDTASTESAMEHALKWLKFNEDYHPDAIVLLQCTSPVRNTDAIDNAVKQFYKEKADSLLSVCPFWHFLWVSESGKSKALYDFKNRPRRQDISASDIKYKENGSIYVSNSRGFLTHQNRLFDKISLFEMSEEESLEIDTELDMEMINSILVSRFTRGQS